MTSNIRCPHCDHSTTLSAVGNATTVTCSDCGQPFAVARLAPIAGYSPLIRAAMIGFVVALVSSALGWLPLTGVVLTECTAEYIAFPSVAAPWAAIDLSFAGQPAVELLSLCAFPLAFSLGLLVAWRVRPSNRVEDIAAGTSAGLAASIASFTLAIGCASMIFMTVMRSVPDLQLLGRATAMRTATPRPTEPLAIHEHQAGELGKTLDFLEDEESELLWLGRHFGRKARLWKDKLQVIDVNGKFIEVRGLAGLHDDVKAILGRWGARHEPGTVHELPADGYREFWQIGEAPWPSDELEPADILVTAYPDLEAVAPEDRGMKVFGKIIADSVIGTACGIWLGVLVCVWVAGTLGVYSTAAAGYLIRRDGWCWGILMPYLELCLAGAAITAIPFVCFSSWPLLRHLILLSLLLVFVAVFLVVAVTNCWHWQPRLLFLIAIGLTFTDSPPLLTASIYVSVVVMLFVRWRWRPEATADS